MYFRVPTRGLGQIVHGSEFMGLGLILRKSRHQKMPKVFKPATRWSR